MFTVLIFRILLVRKTINEIFCFALIKRSARKKEADYKIDEEDNIEKGKGSENLGN